MNNRIECANAFFFYYINQIGGVETFFYEIAKKYHAYDITVFYISGDPEQIKRLRQYVKVIQLTNQSVKCEKAFFNYNISYIDRFHAKEYYSIIHADYKAQGLMPQTHPKIKYIGVSELACKSFSELTGKPCELCYNPLTIEKPKKVLTLITASRLTKEKGKDRMIKLGSMLDKAGIPYIWYVFTNDKKGIDNPHMIYMQPSLDIRNYLANADYMVQLSDTESYCYTLVEALCVGTPVIVCNWPVLKELGVTEDYGFILDFDMKKVPLEEIYNKKFDFTYTPKEDNWDNILSHTPATYLTEDSGKCDALVLYNFVDKYSGKHWSKGETIYNLDINRAREINNSQWCILNKKQLLSFAENKKEPVN